MDNKRLEMLLDTIITNKMILDKAREDFNNAVAELNDSYGSIKVDELDENLTSKMNVAENVLVTTMEENERYNKEILGENSDRGRVN